MKNRITVLTVLAAFHPVLSDAAQREDTQDAPGIQKSVSLSQFGITWTFDKEYTCGQFANGDFALEYVSCAYRSLGHVRC